MSVAKDKTLALTAEERLKLQAAPVKEVPDVYPAATVAVMRNPELCQLPVELGSSMVATGITFWVSICTPSIGRTADSAAARIG